MKRTYACVSSAAAAIYALIAIALWIWPGADAAVVCIGAALTGCIGWGAWRLSDGRDAASLAVLAVALAVLTAGMIVNINYYTEVCGGTPDAPVLINHDHERNWLQATGVLDGIDSPNMLPSNYLMAALLWTAGRDIAVPIFFNIACALVTLVLVHGIALRLFGRRDVALAAMIMLCCMCYFMAQATTFIKDVPVTMAFAMAALAAVGISSAGGRAGARDAALMAGAIALLALFRNNALPFIAVGAAVYGVSRRSRPAAWVVIAVAALAVWQTVHWLNPISNIEQIVTTSSSKDVIIITEGSRPWDNAIGDYTVMPWWRKLMLLPLSVVVQFLIPFPWNFARDAVFGPFHALAHFGYPWYLAGGIFLYYISSRRLHGNAQAVRTALWAVACTVIVAYLTSGRISRYCLPFLPMILPAAAYALCTSLRRRSFQIWMGAFCLMLAGTLVVCYKMQHPCL